jgi:hypothetical protein
MTKPISQSECADFLREFFSPEASVVLAAELFSIEEEAGENFILGANICSRWEEFPSFESAQAAVGGAYIPDGIYFSGGGFLMRK